MLLKRVIPILLLKDECLVKTRSFNNFTYVGDPSNTVRIFNELEVDELFFLDISSSRYNNGPNYALLKTIADECFMPLGYGGGISSVDQAKKIFEIGFEKISLNTVLYSNLDLVDSIANQFGSQSVVASVDVKRDMFGICRPFSHSGTRCGKNNLLDWCKELEQSGVGEILLTSIDKEGSWSGFDLDLVKLVSNSVSIPVIAHGGAGSTEDVDQVFNQTAASAVGLGSMVTFQKKDMGVLVHFDSSLHQL